MWKFSNLQKTDFAVACNIGSNHAFSIICHKHFKKNTCTFVIDCLECPEIMIDNMVIDNERSWILENARYIYCMQRSIIQVCCLLNDLEWSLPARRLIEKSIFSSLGKYLQLIYSQICCCQHVYCMCTCWSTGSGIFFLNNMFIVENTLLHCG